MPPFVALAVASAGVLLTVAVIAAAFPALLSPIF